MFRGGFYPRQTLLVEDALDWLSLDAYNLSGSLLGLLNVLHEGEGQDLLDRVVVCQEHAIRSG